jgi:threonine dehydrogenase-like Zn-dependent dehydrogenase
MAAIVVRHAGARYVAISDVSEYRLDLARRIGVTLAVNTAGTRLGDVLAELGMREGFHVGLEMSGKRAALREILAIMTHAGKIAMLGLPAEDFGIDWSHLVTNMITIKGIDGRQMFETWYEVSVLIHSRRSARHGTLAPKRHFLSLTVASSMNWAAHQQPLRYGLAQPRSTSMRSVNSSPNLAMTRGWLR